MKQSLGGGGARKECILKALSCFNTNLFSIRTAFEMENAEDSCTLGPGSGY